MGQPQVGPESNRRVVLAYHGLPVVTALTLVAVFLGVFFFTKSFLLSGIAAAVPSFFLVWRWILAGREIDRRGCPQCGAPFPNRMYWIYPPSVCPRCGERLLR